MNHCGTQPLETGRLLLRPFRLTDAGAAFRNWCSDPRVTEFLTWPPHADPSVTERVISSWVERYPQPDYYQWAIELKRLGEPIGSITVVQSNEDLGLAHIGYCVGHDWWHQGIMTEAFSAVIAFLCGTVGFNRIEAGHDTANPRSGAVMRKCGLKYEGTLRQAARNNRGIVDICMYGGLREELMGDAAQVEG
ncbi:MAG: GNAT family N-acetyltransferase [Clostridia bacterium]|nr:GNAT family N-acetyltransferase [Clostridia bacterium]